MLLHRIVKGNSGHQILDYWHSFGSILLLLTVTVHFRHYLSVINRSNGFNIPRGYLGHLTPFPAWRGGGGGGGIRSS